MDYSRFSINNRSNAGGVCEVNIEIVELLTYLIVGLSIWCFSNIVSTIKTIRACVIHNRSTNRQDVCSLLISIMMFCVMIFVLCVEPGLIKQLPSVFASSIVGASFVLFYVSDLLKHKQKRAGDFKDRSVDLK